MPLKTPELTKFTTASQVIASYDYTDFADGTGIIGFYGISVMIDNTTANNEYILVKDPVISAFVDGSEAQTYMADTEEIDFDLKFNKAQTVTGNATIVLPVTGSSAGGRPKVDIYHYDGTTETSIATQVELINIGAAAQLDLVTKMPLTTKRFNPGDILRLRITATGGTMTLRHDPTGSTAALVYSGGTMRAYIPFLIQE